MQTIITCHICRLIYAVVFIRRMSRVPKKPDPDYVVVSAITRLHRKDIELMNSFDISITYKCGVSKFPVTAQNILGLHVHAILKMWHIYVLAAAIKNYRGVHRR